MKYGLLYDEADARTGPHWRRYLERLDRFEFVRLRSQREIEAWLASGTGG